MTMYEQSQQSDWLQTELESMSLQAASPAKTSQSRDTSEALRQSVVDCGQSAPVCLGSFDPNTPSLKTSQTCLMENGELGLSEFSGTFPRSGMMRNGTVYQLPNLARTTTEIGSGLWHTPKASDYKSVTSNIEYHRKRVDKELSCQVATLENDTSPMNPEWVEWLMGFPLGHTDLNA